MTPRPAPPSVPSWAARVGASWAAAMAGLALLLYATSCRAPADASEPVAGHGELCCKHAMADNLSFTGCRTEAPCRAPEAIWVRGPVECTPTGVEGCEGGRCCTLVLPPPAELASIDGPEKTEGHGGEEHGGEERGGGDALGDAPAPITPIPLDWQPTPTPVAIPTYVCPASLERGVAGTVLLHVEVDVNGRVTTVAVRESLDPECDALARDALLHADFEPALTPEGEPIAASLRWVYRFEDPRADRTPGVSPRRGAR